MKKILSTIIILTLMISMFITADALSLTIKEEDIINSGSLRYILLEDGTASIVGTTDDTLTHLTIPSTIDEYTVSKVDSEAFKGNRKLRSVTIEEGIHTISYRAFYNCTNLETFDLPESLRNIGNSAFKNTAAYDNPANRDGYVRYIDNFLIASTDNTLARPSAEYTVKEGTVGIASFAFENHNKLETIYFPDSLKYIDDRAFDNCSSLRKADLPKSLESIGEGAFSGCTLEEVVIPETITRLERYCFSQNDMKEIKLHDKITFIGDHTFLNCDNLTEVTIPESVTQLSEGIFWHCDSLHTINLHDKITKIGSGIVYETSFYNNPHNWEDGCLYTDNYILEGDTSYEGVLKIKDGTRIIADNSFFGAENITSVILPQSLEVIGHTAFRDCLNLSYINIPEKVKEIGAYTFMGCRSLKSFYIPENITSVGYQAFHHCINLKTITVANPCATLDEKAMGFFTVYDTDWSVAGYCPVEGFTIRGLKDSTAESYATENKLNFEEIIIPEITGDIDGDTVLTIKDATYIQKSLANLIPLLKEQKPWADTDADGIITIKDATKIQKTLTEL